MKHDYLDDAIDAVAGRMTSVKEDDGLALRIANALPERSAWTLHWLVPRLAITAVVAIGVSLVVLRTFDDRSTDVLRSEVVSAPAIELAAAALEHRTNLEPAQIVRSTSVERPQNDRGTLDVPDHERSLSSIAAVAALNIDSLAPVTLPEDAPLTLSPLTIVDLPLTAETISPR